MLVAGSGPMDPHGQGDDLAAAAMSAAERGDMPETERLARRALVLAERVADGSRRDALCARALRPLGTAQRARGQYHEAEQTFRRALASASVGFGPGAWRSRSSTTTSG